MGSVLPVNTFDVFQKHELFLKLNRPHPCEGTHKDTSPKKERSLTVQLAGGAGLKNQSRVLGVIIIFCLF